MSTVKYVSPKCETGDYLSESVILAGSAFTDDGAGDMLLPGDDFIL